MASSPKTIADLPRFRVAAVSSEKNEQGYFVLSGTLNRTEGVNEGGCSFIVPSDDVLAAFAAYLTLDDASAGTVTVYISADSQPAVMGRDLTYVPPMWNPPHVWMVAEPRWRWEKNLFHARDAVAEPVKGEHTSIVEDEEITDWIKIKEKGKDTGLSRYYPIFPSGKHPLPTIAPNGVIEGGWNHAHCELCHSHIESGTYGYVDPGEHWICEDCYSRYVRSHDLAFMFQ